MLLLPFLAMDRSVPPVLCCAGLASIQPSELESAGYGCELKTVAKQAFASLSESLVGKSMLEAWICCAAPVYPGVCVCVCVCFCLSLQ